MIHPSTTENIRAAAAAIQQGQLVVMPTETVYGLAADATRSNAVQRIFIAKGRPSNNPLIAHVSDVAQAKHLAEWSELAEQLATAFWPGPLTLVLTSRGSVAREVQAGLPTVAIRMPAHPVAQRLISEAGVPLAAPSANTFMRLSPTLAEHVEPAIAEQAAMVLDGGPCEVGIESTIVSLTDNSLVILRSGMISEVDLSRYGVVQYAGPGEIRAPGMYPRHYSPVARVRLVEYADPETPALTWWCSTLPQIGMPRVPSAYAARLYAALHELDELQPAEIQIEAPPRTAEWQAVWDRLDRMSFRDAEV